MTMINCAFIKGVRLAQSIDFQVGSYKTVFDEDWGTAEDEAKTARGNLGQGSAKAAQKLKFKMKPGPTGTREDA